MGVTWSSEPTGWSIKMSASSGEITVEVEYFSAHNTGGPAGLMNAMEEAYKRLKAAMFPAANDAAFWQMAGNDVE